MDITYGPLVLPLVQLFLLPALLMGMLWAWYLGRRYESRNGPALCLAVIAGFGVARCVYVMAHWDYYGQQPPDILKLWQGGFEPVSGIAAAALIALLLRRRQGSHWQPVFLPMLAGLMTWGTLTGFALVLKKEIQQPLPDLALMTLANKQVQLSRYQRGPLVINLWASWCPPCRAEMPVLAAAEQANPAIRFVYINQGEDLATTELYLAEEGFALDTVLRDPSSSASKQLKARAIPTTLFYDAHGQLVGRYTGELSYPRLSALINELQ